MKILITLFLGIPIYALQAQHAYSDAIRINHFIQHTPKSTPAKDTIEIVDTLFNMGKMVSETYSPDLRDSILIILAKYYTVDSLTSALDSNSILFNPDLSQLSTYLFTYYKTTWPKLNLVETRKNINTLGGYKFGNEEPGIDFSKFKINRATYSQLVYSAWLNYLNQSANQQIILAYLNLVQTASSNPDNSNFFKALMPQIKNYLDQHKDPTKWSTDMLNIKNAMKKDLVYIKTNMNSLNRLPLRFLHPDEVNHLFNLLLKDIHDLKKSYGMDEVNQVVLNGLEQGSEAFKLQRLFSLCVLTLSFTDPASGRLLGNINELKETEIYKIYLGLIYAGLNKLLIEKDGL